MTTHLDETKESSNKTPRVSVIIPTYNCAPFIHEAIDSILSQASPSWELIVIDDGSTDETRSMLTPYRERVRYIHQDNQGVSAARNHGLWLAAGEYAVFLDADDYLLPNKLDKQVAFLDARPSVGMIHSGWRLVNEHRETIADVQPWHTAPKLNLKTWLLWKPVFPGAMMFRVDWLRRVGGFDSKLHQAEDVDLVLRLALLGCKAAWIREPTVCYRQHSLNTRRDHLQQVASLNRVMDKFFQRPDVPMHIRRSEKRIRYYTLMWCAWELYGAGQLAHLIQCLRRSLTYTDLPVRYAMLDWLDQFAAWSDADGRSLGELRALWPIFRLAAQLNEEIWPRTERVLNWWVDSWWFYLNEDYEMAAQGLHPYKGLRTVELVRLVQAGLLVTPKPTSVKAVRHFWRDAIQTGLVHPFLYHEVTALYLTVFAQAVFSRRFSMALRALLRAIQAGSHLKALHAWFRFFRAAFHYFLLGRPEEDSSQ